MVKKKKKKYCVLFLIALWENHSPGTKGPKALNLSHLVDLKSCSGKYVLVYCSVISVLKLYN